MERNDKMEKIRFAHLADTHLCREGKASFLDIPVRENFEKAIDYFCGLHNKPEFVVVTGDVVNDGDLEDYRFAKTFIEKMQQKLGAPIFLAIGNHDDRANFFEGYLGTDAQPSYCYPKNINGLRLIVLDSANGDVNGKIGPEQLSWLKKELMKPAACGTVLAFHHPLAVDEFMLGEHCLEDAEDLYAVIRGTDVVGVLTGHTHRSNQSIVLDNVLSVTADSVAYSLDVNGDDVKMTERFGFNMLTVMDKTMYNSTVQVGSETVIGRYSLSGMMDMIQKMTQEPGLTMDGMEAFEKFIRGEK